MHTGSEHKAVEVARIFRNQLIGNLIIELCCITLILKIYNIKCTNAISLL